MSGTIVMDSDSVFHMTNGANMDWTDGGLLDITIRDGNNYIVIGDYDAYSSITMSTVYDWTTGNLIVRGDSKEREWKLEVSGDLNQIILYYAVPEPATYTALFGAAAAPHNSAKRRNTRRCAAQHFYIGIEKS